MLVGFPPNLKLMSTHAEPRYQQMELLKQVYWGSSGFERAGRDIQAVPDSVHEKSVDVTLVQGFEAMNLEGLAAPNRVKSLGALPWEAQ